MRRPTDAPVDESPILETDSRTSWLFDDIEIVTARNLAEPLQLRRRPRRRCLAAIRQEELAAFFTQLPAPGESVHTVSNGSFDYFAFIPTILDLLGRQADELYGSTWTMNRGNVRDLLALFDAGRFRRLSIVSGTYFRTRESSVSASLVEGLRARGQRYRAFANHAKIILISAPPDYLVVEGSANWTSNPRLEQNVVSNDAGLYQFHRAWFEEMLEVTE